MVLVLLMVPGATMLASEGTPMAPGGRDGLIAFDSSGDIWVTMADGSERRQLTTGEAFDFSPMWSPDGQRLAFWSMPVAQDAAVGGFDYDAYVDALRAPDVSVVVVDADGMHPHVVADGLVLGTGEATLEVPVWSPDGTRLAIAHLVDGTWAIDLANPAGDSVTRLAVPGSDPAWSPDGSLVAYKGGASDADSGVYLVDADGGLPRRLTRQPTTGDDVFSSPQWSPDGRTIAYFSGVGGTGDVWSVSVDGADERVLIGGPGNEYRAAYSPDGSRIAFDRTVETADIVRFVVAPADLSSELVLESPPMWGLQPVWAPEGDWLLGYRADDGYASQSLVIVDTTGKRAAAEIPAPSEIGLASWQRVAP